MFDRRRDYAFPFRVDPASAQIAASSYEAHVEEMLIQLLLTSPGERVNLPEFGCGLRQLVFAPHGPALDASTKMLVQRAIATWLGDQVRLVDVTVSSPGGDADAIEVLVRYELIETRSQRGVTILVTP